ncbi:pirin family protein [Glycomyces tarimensis]
MSNVEAEPDALRYGPPADGIRPGGEPPAEVLSAREVPLGGVRGLSVRRTLPQRARTLIGAWCFADHYGPVEVPPGDGMDMPPHPHTGLQTASWLFSGVIEHRDSLGTVGLVRPGELNLMTGGRGIAHSEVSLPETRVLHGVQLWIALPEAHRDTDRAFAHYAPEPVRIDGATLRVFLGSLAGAASPLATFTPLLGAQIDIEPGARLTLAVDPEFEHGLLVDTGAVSIASARVEAAELGYLPCGASEVTLVNETGEPARTLLLGGAPFDEAIVMWWNFIGRSHDDIVQAREEWEAASDRFGEVVGYPGRRLPAPALPNAVITPRANPARRTGE